MYSFFLCTAFESSDKLRQKFDGVGEEEVEVEEERERESARKS